MKQVLIITFSVLISFCASAQITVPDEHKTQRTEKKLSKDDDDRWFDKQKIFTGGGFGLSLGQSLFLECSPTLGYKVTERFWPGVGFNYQYWRQTDQSGAVYKQNITGWRSFASYQIIESIIGYAEYESLKVNYLGQDIYMNNSWVGVGLRQWIGSGSAIDAMILRNLNYSPTNVQYYFYNGPWSFRMGLVIGFN